MKESIAAVLYEHEFGNGIGFLEKKECDELAQVLSDELSHVLRTVPLEVEKIGDFPWTTPKGGKVGTVKDRLGWRGWRDLLSSLKDVRT